MVDWEVTATTLYCDAVDEDVTIIVYGDWSAKCERNYRESVSKKGLELKMGKSNHMLMCEGGECTRVMKYRNQLKIEEQK